LSTGFRFDFPGATTVEAVLEAIFLSDGLPADGLPDDGLPADGFPSDGLPDLWLVDCLAFEAVDCEASLDAASPEMSVALTVGAFDADRSESLLAIESTDEDFAGGAGGVGVDDACDCAASLRSGGGPLTRGLFADFRFASVARFSPSVIFCGRGGGLAARFSRSSPAGVCGPGERSGGCGGCGGCDILNALLDDQLDRRRALRRGVGRIVLTCQGDPAHASSTS
jgi:hypothetical protein